METIVVAAAEIEPEYANKMWRLEQLLGAQAFSTSLLNEKNRPFIPSGSPTLSFPYIPSLLIPLLASTSAPTRSDVQC